MRIDLALLTRLDACAAHSNAFAAAFPDGLTVTGEPNADAIARIVAAGLDVGWFCGMVLTALALDAYREAIAPAAAAYDEATAPAAAAYDEATAPALDAYREAIAPALDAYREATATDDAAYREVTATAAWRLLTSTDNIRPEYRQ